MKIAIDIRCLMNPNYSGVAQYAYNQLDNLFKLDSQNQYKLFYNSSQNIEANLPKFNYPNVRFYGFKYPNKLLNSSFLFLHWPAIDQLVSGCDIFFLPNPNFYSFSPDARIVTTIHDLSFELYPDFFSAKQRIWHKLINAKKLAAKSRAIIADSSNTKNDLVKLYGIAESKIKVIYPGIDHAKYKVIEPGQLQEIKNSYNLPDSFILFLGTIEPRKNIEGIIDAFNLAKAEYQALENLNLVIAGAKGWKCQRIFQAAEKSPFANQIKFLGYVPEADKPYLYNLAGLFVFPSFYEGFGLPVLEAQACGLPVIASDISAFPEVLSDSAYLINPDNLNEIAQAINQIFSQSELKQSLIQKGLQNSQGFSWQNCAQETLNLISNS